MGQAVTAEMIRSLPKVELHIHGEAIISYDSYLLLNQKYKVDTSLKKAADFQKLFSMSSLSDMIRNFFFLQSMFREPEDVKLLITDVEKYCAANNIRYMEMHMSPSMVLRSGYLSFPQMFGPVVDGCEELEARGGPSIKVIVDLSRSFGHDNAERNFNHLCDFLSSRDTKRIVGVGLGGQEQDNSCLLYSDLFQEAKKKGLHVVIHAGEEVGPESVWDAVTKAGAERIGHGTSAIQDEKLMDMLKERAIPLEVCPTSNIITKKYVQSYETHPVGEFMKRGLNVTINTDDPVLFDIDLVTEYLNLSKAFNLDIAQVGALAANGIKASFMSDPEKVVRLNDLKKALKKLGA